MKIRMLAAADVRAALPMPKAIEAMKQAYMQFSSGRSTVPLRTHVQTEKGVSLLMPAYLHDSRNLGVKIISIYEDNPQRNLPTISATVMVLDPDTGFPLALIDGGSLTAIRTGAGGGAAADVLARKNAGNVALFGAGVQARTQGGVGGPRDHRGQHHRSFCGGRDASRRRGCRLARFSPGVAGPSPG